ncbi:MATE family efflux transporter [Oceanobacillus sp. CF4.6]|uniref:MATE family efflux transporter n=1 Tax=Oceanobacillus sp. CF4.6 TaxID=3373080 RepID=UPI003EE81450
MLNPTSELITDKNKEATSIPKFSLLFIPILMEQFFSLLLGNVDVLMLSQYSDEAVAAVGLSNQILMVGLMILGIVSLGSSIQLMQLIGSPRKSYIKSIIRHSVYLNIVISLGLAIIFIVFGRTILSWIQTPAQLLDGAYVYLMVVGISLVFQSLITSMSTILRCFTFVKMVMAISIITNIINIIGNYIVILSPLEFLGTGIQGVATSTIIARLIGAILFIIYFIRLLPNYLSSFNTMKLEKKTIQSIFKLGFPSAMENVSYTTSQLIITGIIAIFGTAMVTSKIYTQNITAIIFTLAASISLANQIIIGRYLGMDLKKEAKETTNQLIFKSVGIAILTATMLALSSSFIIPIFTDNPHIQEMVFMLVWMGVLLEPARMVNEIIIGALNTAGDVKFPTMVSILVTYLFTVPMSFLIGVYFGYGLVGVWIVFILDEWIRAIILYIRWSSESWREIRIFDSNELVKGE